MGLVVVCIDDLNHKDSHKQVDVTKYLKKGRTYTVSQENQSLDGRLCYFLFEVRNPLTDNWAGWKASRFQPLDDVPTVASLFDLNNIDPQVKEEAENDNPYPKVKVPLVAENSLDEALIKLEECMEAANELLMSLQSP